MERDNDRVAKWNFRVREEHEREVRNLKRIAHQNTLWGGGLSGEEFAKCFRKKIERIVIMN